MKFNREEMETALSNKFRRWPLATDARVSAMHIALDAIEEFAKQNGETVAGSQTLYKMVTWQGSICPVPGHQFVCARAWGQEPRVAMAKDFNWTIDDMQSQVVEWCPA